MPPRTRYARSGDVHLAYQVVGDGPRDLVVVHGLSSNVEVYWEDPYFARFANELASFSRLLLFDKRGTGLSDPIADVPTLEERSEDLRAVMDAAGVEEASLLGISEGAPMSLLFAATHPDRVRSLVLFGGMARCAGAEDYPYAPPREAFLRAVEELIAPHWGEPVTIETIAPSIADDPEARERWTRLSHASASPSTIATLYMMALDVDVRDILPHVHVPTLVMHRRGDHTVSAHGARWMARQIPDARFVELEGIDHFPWIGDQEAVLSEIEEFVTGERRAAPTDRVLATVMFTDIVGSTGRASELGDRAWHQLLDQHHEAIRRQLEQHRGVERKTLGDGFLVTFDGPMRALHCAAGIRDALRELDVPVRIGVHTGEVELQGEDVAGIAVHIAARVMAHADAGEILVSSTVRDLVVGSGLQFADRGRHTLKGIPAEWQLLELDGH